RAREDGALERFSRGNVAAACLPQASLGRARGETSHYINRRRASRRRRATVRREIASQPLHCLGFSRTMREGCLHATPPSQETGEVRNLVWQFSEYLQKP